MEYFFFMGKVVKHRNGLPREVVLRMLNWHLRIWFNGGRGAGVCDPKSFPALTFIYEDDINYLLR